MLNELIGVFLGCIHYYVDEQYYQIVDAVSVPVMAVLVLIFVLVLSLRAFSALVRAVWGGR